jgi:hypothetical protein
MYIPNPLIVEVMNLACGWTRQSSKFEQRVHLMLCQAFCQQGRTGTIP